MLVVHVDIVAIYGSRASEATKKPKGSYCQAWPTPRQVYSSIAERTWTTPRNILLIDVITHVSAGL